MTVNYYTYEEDLDADEWYAAYDLDYQLDGNTAHLPFDVVTLAAAILVIIALVFVIQFVYSDAIEDVNTQAVIFSQPARELPEETPLSPPLFTERATIIAPYDQYIVTQGVHGQSYGHMAIDIAAGKGEIIKSPIEGTVTEYYFDGIGNPTLVIENDQYAVTLLHGNYTVNVGDRLGIGDAVGTEGNLGNTRDMQGRSCRNRDCGYHTHLNVFDKIAGTNVNPLELIGA